VIGTATSLECSRKGNIVSPVYLHPLRGEEEDEEEEEGPLPRTWFVGGWLLLYTHLMEAGGRTMVESAEMFSRAIVFNQDIWDEQGHQEVSLTRRALQGGVALPGGSSGTALQDLPDAPPCASLLKSRGYPVSFWFPENGRWYCCASELPDEPS